MVQYASVDNWEYETDVLIVGFGGAGACAAIAAADQGADVLIVEKQAEGDYYSNTRMSGGAFHSPNPDGDTAALEEYALAMFSGDNLPWKLEGELPSDIAPNSPRRGRSTRPRTSPGCNTSIRSSVPSKSVGQPFPSFPERRRQRTRYSEARTPARSTTRTGVRETTRSR